MAFFRRRSGPGDVRTITIVGLNDATSDTRVSILAGKNKKILIILPRGCKMEVTLPVQASNSSSRKAMMMMLIESNYSNSLGKRDNVTADTLVAFIRDTSRHIFLMDDQNIIFNGQTVTQQQPTREQAQKFEKSKLSTDQCKFSVSRMAYLDKGNNGFVQRLTQLLFQPNQREGQSDSDGSDEFVVVAPAAPSYLAVKTTLIEEYGDGVFRAHKEVVLERLRLAHGNEKRSSTSSSSSFALQESIVAPTYDTQQQAETSSALDRFAQHATWEGLEAIPLEQRAPVKTAMLLDSSQHFLPSHEIGALFKESPNDDVYEGNGLHQRIANNYSHSFNLETEVLSS